MAELAALDTRLASAVEEQRGHAETVAAREQHAEVLAKRLGLQQQQDGATLAQEFAHAASALGPSPAVDLDASAERVRAHVSAAAESHQPPATRAGCNADAGNGGKGRRPRCKTFADTVANRSSADATTRCSLAPGSTFRNLRGARSEAKSLRADMQDRTTLLEGQVPLHAGDLGQSTWGSFAGSSEFDCGGEHRCFGSGPSCCQRVRAMPGPQPPSSQIIRARWRACRRTPRSTRARAPP